METSLCAKPNPSKKVLEKLLAIRAREMAEYNCELP
jgi:hypothetical protein